MSSLKKRQLSAILFADIVGYTSLMQAEESTALTKLHQFKQQLSEKTALYNGQIIQFYGDGCLVTFDSAIDAVTCAQDLQFAFQKTPTVPVRMGIHSGEVVFEDGNIFGDSVNVASRIESLGIAGSILFSTSIRDQINNWPAFQFESLGVIALKNITNEIEIFALSNNPIPTQKELHEKSHPIPVSKHSGKELTIGIAIALSALVLFIGISTFKATEEFMPLPIVMDIPDVAIETKKSIGILPFTNRSSNEENKYFTEGIHDDLLTMLSYIEGIKVISRTSMEHYKDTDKTIPQIAKELGVAYIVEGGVQRAGNQVRINVQLIDPSQDDHIWANIYTEAFNTQNIFEVQGDIAKNIANALAATLSPQQTAALKRTPTNNLEAYNSFLLARHKIGIRTSKELKEAKNLLEQAIDIDPNFAKAHVSLALTYHLLNYYADMSQQETIEKMNFHLQQAFALDSTFAESYAIRGLLKEKSPNGILSARADFRKAIAINPNLIEAYNWLANNYGRTEEREKALDLRLKAATIDPLSVLNLQGIGWIYAALGNHKKVLEYYRKSQQVSPNYAQNYWMLGYHYLNQTNRIDQALYLCDKAIYHDSTSLRYYFNKLDALLDLRLEDESQLLINKMEQLDEHFVLTHWSKVLWLQYNKQYREALQFFTQSEKYPDPSTLANLYFNVSDYTRAKEQMEVSHPQWKEDLQELTLTSIELWDAIIYAGILKGENTSVQKATELLDKCLITYHKYEVGYFVIPTHKMWILTLQGDIEAAMITLEETIDLQHSLADWWELETHPVFEPLRNHPRYSAAIEQVKKTIKKQQHTYQKERETLALME